MFIPPKPDCLAPLLPEETERPYAPFYWRGACRPPDDILMHMAPGQPLPEKDALRPEQAGLMLEPGYMDAESGYCLLPDGTGYAAALSRMPGVSMEMIGWWTRWHEAEDLRYKLWCPGSHSRVGPLWMQENVGMGLEDLFVVRRMQASDYGMQAERMRRNPDILGVFGSDMLVKAAGVPEARPIPMVIMHMVRRIQDGVEFRTRIWMGLHMAEGAVQRFDCIGAIEPERACGFACHSAYEMATLAAILPELYAAYGPRQKNRTV